MSSLSTPVRLNILIITTIRIFLHTAYRMVYPFLSVFARGFGVDVATMSLAIATRAFMGAFSPLLASVADSRGRKVGMLLGIGLYTLGICLIVFFPYFPVLVITLVLTTLGKYVFDPAIQAYIGDQVPYQQRGSIVALTETSWSLSFIAGVPLAGFLISKFGWMGPFPLLLLLGVLSFAILLRILPSENYGREKINSALLKNTKLVFASTPALCILAVSFLISCANELVNLVFGLWMEDSFGLQIAALGAASAVIGISELGGEGLSATITDRLGKKRSVLWGAIINSVAALLLPLIGRISVWGALAGLFLFYISFEFTIVSSIPIMTEILPGARATLMAMNIAVISLGRAIGSTISPHLYGWGIIANAAMCVILNVVAVIVIRSVKID